MALFGERLREERERLGLNQDQLGVTPQAQRRYEKSERHPDLGYLSLFANLGGDVLYVITGNRSVSVVTDEEAKLLEAFRNTPEPVKKAVQAALLAGAMPGGQAVTFGGDIGGAISGGVNTVKISSPLIKKKIINK